MWKKWSVIVGIWIAAVVLVSYHGGRVAYMLLYFSFAIPLASLLYVLWVTFRFKFFQKIGSDTIVKGEPVDYYFSLRNEDCFYYAGIKVEFMQDYSKVLWAEGTPQYHLAGGEGKEFATRLCCNYRGEYEVGVSRFEIGDYLGLFAISYRVPKPLTVTVLPRVTAWEHEWEVFEEPHGRIRGNTRIGEPDVQVRNYETRDGMRQIHWKASAKAGKLMAREREETLRQGMIVFLDLQPFSGEADMQIKYEDAMMEQAVSIVHTCLVRRIPVTLICDWKGTKAYHIGNKKQWKEFYDACGKMDFKAKHMLQELLADDRLLRDMQYAVFLTGTADAGLYEWVKKKFSGVKCCVSFVGEKNQNSARQLYEGVGIRFFQSRIE